MDVNNKNTENAHVSVERVFVPRHIGFTKAFGSNVAAVIGTGIFLSPRGVVSNIGSIGATMIIWAACAVGNICTAIAFTELVGLIPKHGGTYAFVYDAFGFLGPPLAFSITWINLFLNNPASLGVYGRTTATYILSLAFPECGVPTMIINMFSIFLIVGAGALTIYKIDLPVKIVSYFSILKISALVFIIVMGIINAIRGSVKQFAPSTAFEGTVSDPAAVAAAVGNIFAVAEEIKNPGRTLVMAIMTSMSAITFIYILSNMAYFTVMTPADVANEPATALVFARRTIGDLAWIISLCVAMSSLGSNINSTFIISRSMFRVGRDGKIPQCFGMLHFQSKVPILPIIFIVILTSLFHFFTEGVDTLMGLSVFSAQLGELFSMVAFFYFRIKHPEKHRPIKVSVFFPIIAGLISIFLMVFNLIKSPRTYGIGLGIYLTFIPVYLFRTKLVEKIKIINLIMDTITTALQRLLQIVPGGSKEE